MCNFKNVKKMNLDNLNLVELNAQEVQEIEGGFWGYVAAALTYFAVETLTNPVASSNSLMSGFKNGNK